MVLDNLAWEIMDATADDWESIDQILPRVNEFFGSVEALIIAGTLALLVEEGLMRVARPVEEGYMTDVQNGFVVEPRSVVDNPTEYWFCMTPRGRDLWDSESSKYSDKRIS
jgi:hypothetical protein